MIRIEHSVVRWPLYVIVMYGVWEWGYAVGHKFVPAPPPPKETPVVETRYVDDPVNHTVFSNVSLTTREVLDRALENDPIAYTMLTDGLGLDLDRKWRPGQSFDVPIDVTANGKKTRWKYFFLVKPQPFFESESKDL